MFFDARPFEGLSGERSRRPVQDQRQSCADADAVEARESGNRAANRNISAVIGLSLAHALATYPS